jgi:arylsulfatase A
MKFTTLLFSLLLFSMSAWAKPNFVLLLSDDQSWNGLSVPMHPDEERSRHPVYETPNLEKFAAAGMRFSNAYAPAPACSPTRISLQTGRSPAALHWCKAAPAFTATDGLRLIPPHSRNNIRKDEITIAERLKNVGYATAHFGKWHLGGGGPEAHGYDVSDGDTGNKDAAPFKDPNPVDIFGMCNRASKFAAKQKSEDRPFFMQLSFHALHYPENASAKNTAIYQHSIPQGNPKEIGRGALTTDLDEAIGKLLQDLSKLGLDKNTYIVYLSDNGGSGSKRGILRGGKGSLYEGGIRVPMIVRGPGIEPGSWCHERVVGHDLIPTFCALAGVKLGGKGVEIEGVDISSLWTDSGSRLKPRKHQGIGFHFPHYQGSPPHSAWFSGDYKLIRDYETGSESLYRIADDLGETNNLASQEPEILARLSASLSEWLQHVEAKLPAKNPNADPSKENSWKKGGGGGKRKK